MKLKIICYMAKKYFKLNLNLNLRKLYYINFVNINLNENLISI